MARAMKVLAFIGLLCCVYALNNTTTTTPTPTLTPTPSPTHSAFPTSHVMTPTPTPSPKPVPEGNYTIMNGSGVVCLRMLVALDVNNTYNSTNATIGHRTVKLPVINATTDGSTCNESQALLAVKWNVNGSDHYLNFTFTKNESFWAASGTSFTFELNEVVYPDYPNATGTEFVSATTSDKLIKQDDTNRQFNRSYSCGDSRKLHFSNPNFTATLSVVDLQVQAFEFNNQTGFDEAYVCSNNKGNKIVPIAVGAALAGLVIVVLIAYLIGRLKRRNQGSYEALS